MKKYLSIFFIFILLLPIVPLSFLKGDEVTEGFFGGGILGAMVGGAAGGSRGAGIGAAVGSILGATAGATRRSNRRRAYYDDLYSDAIYAQNDELRFENENLIEEHRYLFQKKAKYYWMLNQCKQGKTNYRNIASKKFFDDTTNYNRFLRWQRKSSIRRQNIDLMRINNDLRSRITQLKQRTRQLKYDLENCEAYNN